MPARTTNILTFLPVGANNPPTSIVSPNETDLNPMSTEISVTGDTGMSNPAPIPADIGSVRLIKGKYTVNLKV